MSRPYAQLHRPCSAHSALIEQAQICSLVLKTLGPTVQSQWPAMRARRRRLRDPQHLAVAHERGLAGIGRRAVLDLRVEGPRAPSRRAPPRALPVHGVVDVVGEVEVGRAKAPRRGRAVAADRGGAGARARGAPPPTARRRPRSPGHRPRSRADRIEVDPQRDRLDAPALVAAHVLRRSATRPRSRCTRSPPTACSRSAGSARRAGAGAARSRRRRPAPPSPGDRRTPRPAASARSCPGARGRTARRRRARPARDR